MKGENREQACAMERKTGLRCSIMVTYMMIPRPDSLHQKERSSQKICTGFKSDSSHQQSPVLCSLPNEPPAATRVSWMPPATTPRLVLQ